MAQKRKAQEISDYEAQRQANIAKNQALFKELQLNAASAGLAPKAAPKRQANGESKPKSRPKPKPMVKERVQPSRTSSRLQGIVADSEVARKKAEEEREMAELEAKAKRQRVGGEMKLEDIVSAGQSWNKSGNWLRDVKPANPYERTFDVEEVKSAGSKELKELREKMSGLSLWEDFEPNRIKITPERIYSMSFHPTEDKQLVLAGDKLGNLGLFDGSQGVVKHEDDEADELDESSNPAISTFKTHTRTISSIHFTDTQPNAVYTASYDSSIRRLDLSKGVSTEMYAPAEDDVDEPISGVSIPITDPNMLYFSTLNGLFGMHDTRTDYKGSNTVELMELSEKKIGGFSVHPLHPHYLATASLDRNLKVWDIRKITGSKGHRHPQLVAEHESRLSVSTAAFNAAGQVRLTEPLEICCLLTFFDRLRLQAMMTPLRSITWTNAAHGP